METFLIVLYLSIAFITMGMILGLMEHEKVAGRYKFDVSDHLLVVLFGMLWPIVLLMATGKLIVAEGSKRR